jgi:hypothetical protein
MQLRQPRYSKEEHTRRGTEIYNRQVRPRVEPTSPGKIVAIDVDSGEFEVADNSLTASQQLLARCPDAQIWCVRVGSPAVHRFGPRVTVDRT